MPTAVYYLLAAIVIAVVLHRLWLMGRTYLTMRGERVITCPETKAPAGVEVDAGKAAAQAAAGGVAIELKDCSRWPERAGCDQACVSQIESAPAGCLVRNLLSEWYEGRSCALCGKPVGEIHWHDHRPGLLSPEGRTVEWSEIRAEKLQETLETYRPVCWNCHIAESFRREHPDLVVDRAPRPHAGTETQ